MASRTRYAEFSGDAVDLRLMLEKAKTSATRKGEHGLARMVFEGVDLAPDDTAQMKRIKARVASVRPLVRSTATDNPLNRPPPVPLRFPGASSPLPRITGARFPYT